MWALEFFDEHCELFGAHRPAFMKAHVFVCFAVRDRPVAHAGRVLRLPAHVLERQRHGHERLAHVGFQGLM